MHSVLIKAVVDSISILERSDNVGIAETLRKESYKQVNNIDDAVVDYGEMNKYWAEIDSEGGSITFRGLAQSIVTYLEDIK